jgi:hypothetical protein
LGDSFLGSGCYDGTYRSASNRSGRDNGLCDLFFESGPEAHRAFSRFVAAQIFKKGNAEMQDSKLSRDVFRFYPPRDVWALLETCGEFKDVTIISKRGKAKTLYYALGTS